MTKRQKEATVANTEEMKESLVQDVAGGGVEVQKSYCENDGKPLDIFYGGGRRLSGGRVA